jgi:Phage integrase family
VFERWEAVRPESRFFFSTLEGGRLSERYVQQMVGRYGVRAGVLKATMDGDRPIHPHMLRHSYATRLINAGVPVHAVQRALGHSHLATTSVYLHVSDDELADQLRGALLYGYRGGHAAPAYSRGASSPTGLNDSDTREISKASTACRESARRRGRDAFLQPPGVSSLAGVRPHNGDGARSPIGEPLAARQSSRRLTGRCPGPASSIVPASPCDKTTARRP